MCALNNISSQQVLLAPAYETVGADALVGPSKA